MTPSAPSSRLLVEALQKLEARLESSVRIESAGPFVSHGQAKCQACCAAFRGRKAQDLYYTIFEYEKKHQLKWFSRKDHVAYLGKELKKCEFAILGKGDYVQE